jgi:hypothetical protein
MSEHHHNTVPGPPNFTTELRVTPLCSGLFKQGWPGERPQTRDKSHSDGVLSLSLGAIVSQQTIQVHSASRVLIIAGLSGFFT